jgi:ornithine--oxo-acid transaminase
MTDKVYSSVYDSLARSIIHTSTFSENGLSMRAGLATLDVLADEGLGAKAVVLGETLRSRLRQELSGYEMVDEIRGLGMLSGIAFRAPRSLRLRLSFESFRRVHPAMLGQVIVMRMFREQRILTQMCGNNFMVVKAAPPLIIGIEQIERFVSAIRQVVHQAHHSTEFWAEALGLARRALNV